MAFLPGLVKLVKKVAKPLGKVIESIPGIGTAFKAAENISAPIVSGVQTALKLVKKVPVPAALAAGGGLAAGAGLEALSGGGGAGVPALPGGGGITALSPYNGGLMSTALTGAGTGALMNSQILSALQSIAIPAQNIPVKYAPPRGYVLVRRGTMVMCIPKAIARHFGLWHAGRKPPISAGDWNKYQTARRVEKKLRHLAIHAMRHHNSGSTHAIGKRK